MLQKLLSFFNNKNNKNMLEQLISFYEEEKKLLNKSNNFMKKIYKNRIEENIRGENEAIVFLFDKMGYQYFIGKLDNDYINKLLFGFGELIGINYLENSIYNVLNFRKSNLK